MPVKQELHDSTSADESDQREPSLQAVRASPKKRTAKGSKKAHTEATTTDSLDEQDDFKPDLSDDDVVSNFKPSPAKRGKTSGSTGKNGKRSASTSPTKGKAIPYTPEQDWALVEELRPRIASPNWAAIAQRVGRDSKVSAAHF